MIDIKNLLDNFNVGTKNPTLNAMKYFMEKYNNFDKNMKIIHIAGTNGKGSVTEIISNILIKQGYKVGKFLTPHLIKYNERISINGNNILDKEIENIFIELKPLIDEFNSKEDEKVTKFDLLTITALIYFYRNKVDFVVLETGLGGINDSTNIISNPLVSVISSIGYDHIKILGNSLEKIANKKAGIIKQNSNTVIFDQDENSDIDVDENIGINNIKNHSINEVFIDKCLEKNNKLHIVKNSDISNYRYDNNFQYFDYKEFKNLKLNLKGKIQVKNACVSLEVIEILRKNGYEINIENIKSGLETVVHKGRMEKLYKNPLIIFDGAHNEPAARSFIDTVNMYYKNKNKVYVISILERKDYKKILEIFSKDKKAKFILTSGNKTKRYATSDELYKYMIKYTKSDKIIKKEIDEVLNDIAKEVINRNDIVYFFVGSLYTYGLVVDKINEIKKN